jgi:DNA-binding CsgD family transcriptional regulator
MSALRSSDPDALDRLLRQLYAHRDAADFRTAVVPILSAAVPSDFASYTEVDPSVPRILGITQPESEFIERNMDVLAAHVDEHPLIVHHRATGDGSARRISDFLSDRRYRELGLYADFYGRIDVNYQISVTLPAPEPLVIGLVLSRARSDFSERDRAVLNFLRPHFVQAYENARAVSRLQRDRERVASALEGRRGILVVSRTGRIRFASERGRALLHAFLDPAPRRDDVLPDTLWRWLRGTVVDAAPSRRLALRTPLVLRRGDRELVVRTAESPGGEEAVVLLEERDERADVLALRSLGLSLREAEVLTWVARGKTNVETATILGISPRTVQKHLEAVFRELGVETRTAATVRAVEAWGRRDD